MRSKEKRMILARPEPETSSVLDWCNNQLHHETLQFLCMGQYKVSFKQSLEAVV